MVVLILPMTPGDVDAIVEIEKLSFSTPWSRSALLSELRYPRQAVYLVARVKGRVVGYVGMWTVGNEDILRTLPCIRLQGGCWNRFLSLIARREFISMLSPLRCGSLMSEPGSCMREWVLWHRASEPGIIVIITKMQLLCGDMSRYRIWHFDKGRYTSFCLLLARGEVGEI